MIFHPERTPAVTKVLRKDGVIARRDSISAFSSSTAEHVEDRKPFDPFVGVGVELLGNTRTRYYMSMWSRSIGS